MATKESGERFLVTIKYSENGYVIDGGGEIIESFEKGRDGFSFISSTEDGEMVLVLLMKNRWPRGTGPHTFNALTINNERGTHVITFLGSNERGREYREERFMSGKLKYRTFAIVDENDRLVYYAKVWADGRSMKFSKRIIVVQSERP